MKLSVKLFYICMKILENQYIMYKGSKFLLCVVCSAIIKTIKNFVNAIKIFVNQIVYQNKNKNFVNAIKIFISRLVELFSFSRDLVANFVTTKESLESNFSHIR